MLRMARNVIKRLLDMIICTYATLHWALAQLLRVTTKKGISKLLQHSLFLKAVLVLADFARIILVSKS